MFFGLDYVWRPQLTKNSNQSESLLFWGDKFLDEKNGRGHVIFEWLNPDLVIK